MNHKPLYLAYYALPAALAGVAFYILIPLLKNAGLADFPAYLTALALPREVRAELNRIEAALGRQGEQVEP